MSKNKITSKTELPGAHFDSVAERLKEANLSYSSTVMTQEHEITRLKSILADCVEVLSYHNQDHLQDDLLQKAKEALKEEMRVE
jgi:hypothetical protein